MHRRLALVAAVLLSLAGCGNPPPTSPALLSTSSPTSPLISPVGSWTGQIADAISGEGTLQLTVGEGPNSLGGPWSVAFKNGDRYSGPAVASLSVQNGYGIVLYVEQPPPPCATGPGGGSAAIGFTFINVVVTPSRLTAVVGRTSCNGYSFGTVNLSKQ